MPPEEHNTLNFTDMTPKPVGQEPQPKPTQAQAEANALLQQSAPATPPTPSNLPPAAAPTAPAAEPSVSPAPTQPDQAVPLANQPEPLNPLAQLQQADTVAQTAMTPPATAVTPTATQSAAAPPQPAIAGLAPAAPAAAAIPTPFAKSYTWLNEAAQKLHLQRVINKTVLKYLLIGAVSIGIFILVFNFPIILADIRYRFTKPQPQPAISTQAALSQADVVGPEAQVIIPKLNVTAPIQFPPTLDETQIEVALRDGVVHYAGTALPGDKGNVVIFGHSSNDWWQPGNFKFIFALLDRLGAGDTVQINYQSHKYMYQVTGTKVVSPNDFSVVQPTDQPTLTLITCTPPGTSWKRLVVTAQQIEPAPSNKTAKSEAAVSQPKTLPSDAPASIWTKITNVWNNVF